MIPTTKGMPNFLLADTPYRRDPTRCKHFITRFINTIFVDSPHRHQLFQRFRCEDCGKVIDIPRDVRSAGKNGSVEIEDPRVYTTLRVNQDFFKRFHKEDALDGRYPNRLYQGGLEKEEP